MKTLFIRIIILSLVLVLTGGFCYASKDCTYIKLKPGESTIKINQDTINVQKPYISKNNTMVPLRVITEAFGGEVKWNQNENAVSIIIKNSNIKIAIGKSSAIVDGVEKSLPSAPQIVSGTTMVPIRFISENFGAVVNFDNKTKETTIKIPYRDFKNRFKYINHKQIGDSYYGWSVAYPEGCSIVSKKTSGTSVLVKNEKQGYYYYIYNVKADSIITDEDLLQELLDYVDGERIISQNIIENSNRKWAVVVLESEGEVYEYRAAIKDGRLFQIHLYTNNKEEFLDDIKGEKYKAIIDSFSISYGGYDSNIRDINEIEDGLYTYTNEDYGWTIDLMPSMNRDVEKSVNYYRIQDEEGKQEGITCEVEFFRCNDGQNFNTYVNKKITELYDDINKKYIKELVIENIEVGGIPAKKVKYEITIGNDNYTFWDLYLINENYSYNIYLFANKNVFTNKSETCNKILSSFTPIKSKIVREITNIYEPLRGQTNAYTNELYEWSCKYPAWWRLKEENDSNTVVITDGSDLLEVYIGIAQNTTVDLVRKQLEKKINNLSNTKDFNVIVEQSILEKGIQMYKYVCEYNLEGMMYYYKVYIFSVEDKVFGVHFTVADIVNSENAQRLLNKLWESMQFENQEAI